ncbi:MAG: 16S rRNA (cytosine(967)-C(5))-methyltransferase RsmB [Clostridia bacterium]|nr:16S rRNA (cytosine(967)-C(5))-methyltransferase RsmB [Clostridia bacterium]
MASAREAALKILKKVIDEKAYSNIALNSYFKEHDMDSRDKALTANIVYGVLTNLTYLDYQINSYSKVPFRKISLAVLNILRISMYQIRFLDKIPDSAAVNEGVKLAKKAAFKSSGFVNAVLRAYMKGGEKLPPKDDEVRYLSVLYSYPEWIVELFDRCEELLAAGNEIPPVTIRVNTLKITPEELAERLGAEKCGIYGALNLKKSGSIEDIKEFKDGLFTVQDMAAQKAAMVLEPQEGERILDMCAAPGGKTTHIAELMKNAGEIIAWDKYAHKIALIENMATRLGISNIKAYEKDATEPDEALYGTFDRVLLDAPCSGLGIIRKKPEIKWLRKEDDIPKIICEQKALLSVAANYVKKGGVLLYSTCTINRAENEDILDGFLTAHNDFAKDGEYINLAPHTDKTDGFFIGRLKKVY